MEYCAWKENLIDSKSYSFHAVSCAVQSCAIMMVAALCAAAAKVAVCFIGAIVSSILSLPNP